MATVSDAEISRLMDKACNDIMRPYQEPIRTIYIDTDFLYDYRLGAVLMNVKSEEDYTYVMNHIDEYIGGSSAKITTYFPKLGLTEEDLDLLEEDPKREPLLQVSAPGTKFLADLNNFIIRLNTYNRNKLDSGPLKIYLNQRKHLMSDNIKRELLASIRSVDPYVDIEFTNYKSWTYVPSNLFKQVQLLYVYDLIDFCSVGTVSVAAMRTDSVKDKMLVANFVTEDDYMTGDPEIAKEALGKFAAVMTTLFEKFEFLNKQVLIER